MRVGSSEEKKSAEQEMDLGRGAGGRGGGHRCRGRADGSAS